MKKFVMFALIAALLINLCACTGDSTTGISTEPNFNIKSESQKETFDANEENFPPIEDNSKNYIKKVNVFKGNESISYRNIEYSNIKIIKSKKLINGIKKEDIVYENALEVKTDNDGTLLENKTYVFVTTEITNKTSTRFLTQIYAGIVELDDDYSYTACTLNSVYRSGEISTKLKDYFNQYFEPKAAETYTMALIVDDNILNNDNLYLLLYPEYSDKDDFDNIESQKAYKIN